MRNYPPRPWRAVVVLAALLACGPKNPYQVGGGPAVDAAEEPTPSADGPVAAETAPIADVRPPEDLPRDTRPTPDAAVAADARIAVDAPVAADAPLAIDAPPASPVVSASPASVAGGGTITARWDGVARPTASDWIGLYLPGAPPYPSITWLYTNSCTMVPGVTGKAAGSCPLTVPATAGTYELRLFSTEGYILLARSAPFMVR